MLGVGHPQGQEIDGPPAQQPHDGPKERHSPELKAGHHPLLLVVHPPVSSHLAGREYSGQLRSYSHAAGVLIDAVAAKPAQVNANQRYIAPLGVTRGANIRPLLWAEARDSAPAAPSAKWEPHKRG